MKILAALTGLIFAPSAFAIVNIENLRMDEQKAGWSTSTTLSVKGKRGNTDEDDYGLDGGIQWIDNEHQRGDLLLFSATQSQANQQTYSEAYFVHLRHTEHLTERWAWELFLQHESDPLTDDRLRNLAGTNLRYRLTAIPFNGHAGFGLLQEQRSVEPTGQDKVERETTRFNFYLNSSHQLTETTDWKISLYAQPKTDDWDDMRAIATTGINVKINDTFALTLDLSYSHDSKPLLDQKEYDVSYKSGFNIKF